MHISNKYEIQCQVCGKTREYRSFSFMYFLDKLKAWCNWCKLYQDHEINGKIQEDDSSNIWSTSNSPNN